MQIVRNSVHRDNNCWYWSIKDENSRWDYHTDKNGNGVWQTVMTGRIVRQGNHVPTVIAEEQMVPGTGDFELTDCSLVQAKRKIRAQMC